MPHEGNEQNDKPSFGEILDHYMDEAGQTGLANMEANPEKYRRASAVMIEGFFQGFAAGGRMANDIFRSFLNSFKKDGQK